MGVDAEMFVRTKAAGIDDAFVRRLSHEACARFGRSKFVVLRPGEFMLEPKGQHAFTLLPEGAPYEQDGPDIEPLPGERFIRAHLMTCYWGPGYERGDLAFLLTLAQWLELRVPSCEVWYGGDSSGICAVRFDAAKRREYMLHFASPEGDAYYSKRNPYMDRVERPICDFCAIEMPEFRWGPNDKVGFACAGCGLHALRSPDGTVEFANGDYPDRICCKCNRGTEHSGYDIDGKHWHLACWARVELERREQVGKGKAS